MLQVNGLSRKRNYHGRWEVLIKKCTECFNTMLDMAAKRRRNYILDQVILVRIFGFKNFLGIIGACRR